MLSLRIRGRLAKVAPTPNLDRIAHEGALFSNAFCTNSICSPSRACVITGQYNHINGVFDLGGRIPAGKQMLPIQMKKAGYRNGHDWESGISRMSRRTLTITVSCRDKANTMILNSESVDRSLGARIRFNTRTSMLRMSSLICLLIGWKMDAINQNRFS